MPYIDRRRSPLRDTLLLLGLVLVAGCSGTPADPVQKDPDPDPPMARPEGDLGFLSGPWTVVAVRVSTDGSADTLSGQSTFSRSLSGRAIKEVLKIGLADGGVVEIQSLIAQRGSTGFWSIARGDASKGTFDVLVGGLTLGAGTFSSRADTRPDGGRTRLQYSETFADSFRVAVEHSADAGTTWEATWRLSYTKGGGTAPEGTVLNDCDTERHHQFDFWLGDWSAVGASGTGGGANDIKSRLHGCILEENWVGGANGTSFNMFDVRSELWYQVWVDTNGFLLFLQGTRTGNQMRMEGDAGGSGQRITWTALDDGRVRQLGEAQNASGSWAQSYDLIYSLK